MQTLFVAKMAEKLYHLGLHIPVRPQVQSIWGNTSPPPPIHTKDSRSMGGNHVNEGTCLSKNLELLFFLFQVPRKGCALRSKSIYKRSVILQYLSSKNFTGPSMPGPGHSRGSFKISRPLAVWKKLVQVKQIFWFFFTWIDYFLRQHG